MAELIERVAIVVPEQLVASPRTHQKLMRESLIEELERHHREVMPRHFEQSAAMRYRHAKRNPYYIRMKVRKKGTGRDLVYSGATREKILNEQPRIVISGSGEQIRGRLEMRMAGEKGSGVTGRQFDDDGLEQLTRVLERGTDRRGRPLSPDWVAWAQAKLRARSSQRGKTGVTRAQQVKELRTVTADEAAATVAGLRSRYVEKIKAMKRPRLLAGVTL